MQKSTKLLQKEEKRLEFRMAFMQNKTFECFKAAEDKSGKITQD
jgi:hypothetical protein